MWKVHSCSLEMKGQKRLMWVWLRSFWPMSYHLECLLSEWIFRWIQRFWTSGTALFAHQENRKGLSRIIWSEDSVALESRNFGNYGRSEKKAVPQMVWTCLLVDEPFGLNSPRNSGENSNRMVHPQPKMFIPFLNIRSETKIRDLICNGWLKQIRVLDFRIPRIYSFRSSKQ